MSHHVAARGGFDAARQASRAALLLDASLASAVERLSEPDGWRFSGFAALYLAGWAAGVAAVALAVATAQHPAWLWLASALLGSQLHALTVLQHDCGHRSAYRSAAANLWVGRFLAWFVFMPFTTFTEMHRHHHGALGDAARDPDEWFYEGGARGLFVREWLFVPRFVWLSLTRLPVGPARRRVQRELAFNTLTHAALAAGLWAAGATGVLLYAWLLPMAWLALLFNPISRGYEHWPLATLPACDPRRGDLRCNTVTVRSRLMGVLWAHIGLHVEHHMYPRVPFHRLPALHRLFAGKAYCMATWPLQPLNLTDAPAQPPAGATGTPPHLTGSSA